MSFFDGLIRKKRNQGKVLHICPLDKFIPSFIDFIKENFEFEQHIFFLRGDINQYPVQLSENIIYLKHSSQFISLISEMNKARKIILHSIFISKIVLLLGIQPWLLKKCYWMIWGGDLYYYQFRTRNFKSNIYEKIRTFVIKRIGHFVTYIKGDYELAQKWYGAKGEYHECLMYTSNLYNECAVPHKAVEGNILVGNSAAPTNNHLDVFEKLRPFKDENIKIYCPLSYGNDKYAAYVAKIGKDLFGDKFIPLFEFISFEKYLDLLGQIDMAIFAHKRQQAMGNTITLLGLGKKVYMRNDVTPWALFNELGVKVFDVCKFELTPLNESVRKNNQDKIKSHFSKATFSRQLNDIFKS